MEYTHRGHGGHLGASNFPAEQLLEPGRYVEVTAGRDHEPVDDRRIRRWRLKERGAKLGGVRVPEADQGVPAAGRGQPRVVGEGNGVLPFVRPGQGALKDPGGPVPEPD